MKIDFEKTMAHEKFLNFENDLASNLLEQEKLFKIKTLVSDIISAYNGELDWNEYLRDRTNLNEKIKKRNETKQIDLKSNAFTIEIVCELPILNFEAFSIANMLGKIDRGENK